MSNADATVVVPVYNRATVVLDALASVAAQSHRPRRLIVVDDGSTDDTRQSVQVWMESKQCGFETRLLQHEHRGASAARNLGLACADDCQFVAFLDSDDIWPEDFLARTSAALSADSAAIAASCDRLTVDQKQNETRFESLQPLSEDATRWLFTHDGGIGSASLLRTAAVQQQGGYNPCLPTGHDSDLFLQLSLAGAWLHVPGAPTTFRRGLPQLRGEQQHLSETVPDCHRRWAQIHEDFILHKRGDRFVPADVYSAVLALRWENAARQLLRAGQVDAARECLRRSLHWQFWKPKLWSRLAGTYIGVA